MQRRYRIHTLSARAVIGYAETAGDLYAFHLNSGATERCILRQRGDEQEDNALFYQIQCVLNGGHYQPPAESAVIYGLADVIFYMDFTGIFDRGNSPRCLERQRKAEAMFRPEGIELDFGTGPHTYLAFERSGSMSRQARLSFLRADVYEEVRRRIMLNLSIGQCQLSKLYAYNGLMLSGGTRIDGIDITQRHRVIIVDNPTYTANAKVISVRDDGSKGAVRKYHRVEEMRMLPVTRFDGEGLISKQYAALIDKKLCGKHIHYSFQIRMPYIKGMLHQVDFKAYFKAAGQKTITDIYGVTHPVDQVDIILTRSMFKGYGWLKDNNFGWEDYLSIFRRYDHALYITNIGKPNPESFTELNYQFLNTLSMTAEEFRPADLPLGWDHSPAEDARHWITKATEQRYYDLCASEAYRIDYFANQDTPPGKCVRKNPLLVHEPVCTRELEDAAKHTLHQYALGRLIVAGDNRFLSGDLQELLSLLLEGGLARKQQQRTFYSIAATNSMPENTFYAPGATYEKEPVCTLLRNPHIARNEEIQLKAYAKADQMRKHFLGHLHDVVMVDSVTLAAERLGGADYDGDMIKTIADPLLNECVRRNYEFDSLDNRNNLPLLYIPSEEPVLRDANNWHDRFITVRDTFSSRVGQICNAAFDRSIIAYDENSDAQERRRCREETETLAILTGLEIDSAKSGVKPDLSEYLTRKTTARSRFLKYKVLLDDDADTAWYEPTLAQKRKAFLNSTDWESVTSNVERLPYLAEMLKQHTPRLQPQPALDEELFSFAASPDWREQLDRESLSAVAALLREYESCLHRIRSCRAPIRRRMKQSDIERILFSRGQEEQYDSDTLYAVFSQLMPQTVAELRRQLSEQSWHLMEPEKRMEFLYDHLPSLEDYYPLLCDFHFGGYRVLGDLICDIDDENNATERKNLFRETDSPVFTAMMQAYVDKPLHQNYKEAVAQVCRKELDRLVAPRHAVRYLVALGRRDLLWDLLPDRVEREVLRRDR